MHYRNGREAKNGDKIVFLGWDGGRIEAFGTLRDATPGNDYCNGYIQIGVEPNAHGVSDPIACLCDCLHVDDLAELVRQAGLDKRPEGM